MRKISEEDFQAIDLDKAIGEKLVMFEDVMPDVLMAMSGSNAEQLGFHTAHWPLFNKLCGGQREGELIVITSDTGMGKTTFAINWAVDTVEQDEKILYISLENSMKNIAIQMSQMFFGAQLSKPATKDELERVKRLSEIYGQSIIFYKSGSEAHEDSILKAMVYAVRKFNIRTVVIDHLDAMRPRRGKNESETEAQKSMMFRLLHFTKALGCTTITIQHPSKLGDKGGYKEKDRGDRFIMLDELKGSSAVKQVPDMVVTMRQPSNIKNSMELRFEKIRDFHYGKNRGRTVKFLFLDDCLRFVENATQ